MPLDPVDRGILHELQSDARESTTAAIGDAVGVSASTVSNRIAQMEEDGVIQGYVPVIDYEKAGYPFYVIVSCTAPPPDRLDLAEQALDIEGVTDLQLLMTGRDNFRVTAIGKTRADIAEVEARLHGLGLTIENTPMLERSYQQPFNDFGAAQTE